MRRLRLLGLVLIGLAFPAGLGLAVYVASGSALGGSAATARVPTGTIGRPSRPPTVTTVEEGSETDRRGRCDEEEHRLDPECTGQTTTTGEATTTGKRTTQQQTTTSGDGDSGSSGSGSSDSGRSGRDGSGSGHFGSGEDD